jgi:hypothetical protein
MPAWIAHPLVAMVEGLEWLLARAASAASFLVLAALGHGALRVLPPYVAHHGLHDRVEEIARMPVTGDAPQLRSALMQAVEQQRLGAFIRDGDFRIESRQASRRIVCRYRVPVEILPGRTRMLDFHIDVEQPVLMEGALSFL